MVLLWTTEKIISIFTNVTPGYFKVDLNVFYLKNRCWNLSFSLFLELGITEVQTVANKFKTDKIVRFVRFSRLFSKNWSKTLLRTLHITYLQIQSANHWLIVNGTTENSKFVQKYWYNQIRWSVIYFLFFTIIYQTFLTLRTFFILLCTLNFSFFNVCRTAHNFSPWTLKYTVHYLLVSYSYLSFRPQFSSVLLWCMPNELYELLVRGFFFLLLSPRISNSIPSPMVTSSCSFLFR